MGKISDTWTVLEHGGIERLNERLWRVEGALPGMSLRRVMAVARRDNGGLVIHSAIALGEAEQKALESWGTPEFLLVPNGYHRLDAPRYKRRYPGLRVFAPSGSRAKVAQVVPVDGSYEDFPSDAQVWVQTLPGTASQEGALLVRAEDGVSVVLNDIVMNMDRRRDLLGYLFTTLLGSAPGPRVSRLAKLAIVKDKRALRAELERLAQLPDLARLLVGHDKLSAGQAAARADLLAAARYL
jgi:hypothetical protein